MFSNSYLALMFVLPIFFVGMFTGNLASLAIHPFPALGILAVRLLLTGIANAVVALVLAHILTRTMDWSFFELSRMTCLVSIVGIYVAGAGAGVTASLV